MFYRVTGQAEMVRLDGTTFERPVCLKVQAANDEDAVAGAKDQLENITGCAFFGWTEGPEVGSWETPAEAMRREGGPTLFELAEA